MNSPYFPRSGTCVPQIFKKFSIMQRVHRLPEAMVLVGGDLTLAAEGLEWIALPDGGVALNVGSDFGRENEEAAADPSTIALGFF